MITRYQLTPVSSNRKTGPIATIRVSSNTCPTTCPFNNGGGCYAAGGPEAIHWRKLDKGETGGDWIHLHDQFRAAREDNKLKPGTLLRYATAGDLPTIDGRILNAEQVNRLRGIFQSFGLKPFTYTHHQQTYSNLAVVREQCEQGFTINLSCDTEAQASEMYQRGYASVVVVPADDTRTTWHDSHGTRFVTCPAITGDTTCEKCQLCTKADRSCVVAFRAHGAKRKKVGERLAAAL